MTEEAGMAVDWTDPEEVKAYHREYARKYRCDNQEKMREYACKYREANREKLRVLERERRRKKYRANPEKAIAQERERGRRRREVDPEYDHEYKRRWRENNKEQLQLSRQETKARIEHYKRAKGCLHCGATTRPLLFHHQAPTQKAFNVGQRASCSWGTIMAEASGCVVLCYKCHAIEHARLRELICK